MSRCAWTIPLSAFVLAVMPGSVPKIPASFRCSVGSEFTCGRWRTKHQLCVFASPRRRSWTRPTCKWTRRPASIETPLRNSNPAGTERIKPIGPAFVGAVCPGKNSAAERNHSQRRVENHRVQITMKAGAKPLPARVRLASTQAPQAIGKRRRLTLARAHPGGFGAYCRQNPSHEFPTTSLAGRASPLSNFRVCRAAAAAPSVGHIPRSAEAFRRRRPDAEPIETCGGAASTATNFSISV